MTESKSLWILIVEDDPVFGEAVKEFLVEKDFKALLAVKLAEAMNKLRNQRFDCILLDLNLNGASGEKIVTELRGGNRNINFETPIIVLSGFLEPAVVQRIGPQTQGMMVKPFPLAVLEEKIRAVLKKK